MGCIFAKLIQMVDMGLDRADLASIVLLWRWALNIDLSALALPLLICLA